MAQANRSVPGELIFDFSMMGLVTVFMFMTLSFPSADSLVPYTIGVPALLLTVLMSASHFSTKINKTINWFDTALFSNDNILEEEENESRTGIFRALAWPGLLFSLAFLIGYSLTSLLFIYLFITREGGHSRRRAIQVSVFITVTFVVLFEFVLATPLYEGYLVIYAFDLIVGQ
ncbi:hypothetical protein [Halostagnicola bangensis]